MHVVVLVAVVALPSDSVDMVYSSVPFFQCHHLYPATKRCSWQCFSFVILQDGLRVTVVILVDAGIITRLPHSIHPSCTESSLLIRLKGVICLSSPSAHPSNTRVRTFDRRGSLLVDCRICCAVTGVDCSVSINKTMSPGCGVYVFWNMK